MICCYKLHSRKKDKDKPKKTLIPYWDMQPMFLHLVKSTLVRLFKYAIAEVVAVFPLSQKSAVI
jgi:hypothetical protein